MRTTAFAVASPLIALATLVGAFWSDVHKGSEGYDAGMPAIVNDVLVQDAHRVLTEFEARHQDRFRTALDPTLYDEAFRERVRLAAEMGVTDELEKAGLEIFLADRRVDRARKQAAEANRCASCHHRLGPGGSGGLVDNFFRGRNPPALRGAALLERAAAEISAELATDAATGRSLEAKGISFGTKDSPRGISKDLRVRPFGRGKWATLDEAIAEMGTKALGSELSPSERLALRTWIGTLPPPGVEPPDASRTPDLFERFQKGQRLFGKIGCATCHVPEITLADGTAVRAFTDFRTHDLGPGLADEQNRLHLTAPLWGVAATAPWLHDGRALASLDDAILAHGGEAESTTKAYLALGITKRGELKVFLLSLAPAPKIQIAGQ